MTRDILRVQSLCWFPLQLQSCLAKQDRPLARDATPVAWYFPPSPSPPSTPMPITNIVPSPPINTTLNAARTTAVAMLTHSVAVAATKRFAVLAANSFDENTPTSLFLNPREEWQYRRSL
jgi:hypothetical protein